MKKKERSGNGMWDKNREETGIDSESGNKTRVTDNCYPLVTHFIQHAYFDCYIEKNTNSLKSDIHTNK